ncbi:MAG: HNH endonuclease signature motif containing protein [Candidatus Nanopelagicales bacterium]
MGDRLAAILDASLDAMAAEGSGTQALVRELEMGLVHPAEVEPLMLGLLNQPPGPDLLDLALMLAAVPNVPAVVPVLKLQVLDRYRGWLEAQTHAAVADIAGPLPAGSMDVRAEEVRWALNCSSSYADRRVGQARELDGRCRPTRDALAAAVIGPAHATLLVDMLAGRDDAVTARVQEFVLARAAKATDGMSLTVFRRAIRRALLRFDDHEEKLKLTDASARRRLIRQVDPEHPDESGLWAAMPPQQLLYVWQVLSTLAHRMRRDAVNQAREAARVIALADLSERGIDPESPIGVAAIATAEAAAQETVEGVDAFRVDALVGCIARAAADPDFVPEPRIPIEVQVVVGLPALMGLADDTAELVGWGEIPAAFARELAVDGSWRRLVTDPVSGYLLDYGRTTYRPPKALLDYVVTRDRTCRGRGCHRPARRCELDHVIPFGPPPDHPDFDPDVGGPTSAANLRADCKHLHLLKTHHGWGCEALPDGGTRWTSPRGRVYLQRPPVVLPD